eukprot:NODE_11482_length_304_cov_25.784314_g10569_i0.p3 GENE.NODE_11482_length_304_cov_25.784314_g10569_i0~~NODE_11482_length_304_cov_25.784314_g10569_i0.p3  ORF type:complete len:72 (+),score=25.09 NODE_11482_length_304_cov_25.784314_g10569_i0:25-216(+)
MGDMASEEGGLGQGGSPSRPTDPGRHTRKQSNGPRQALVFPTEEDEDEEKLLEAAIALSLQST